MVTLSSSMLIVEGEGGRGCRKELPIHCHYWKAPFSFFINPLLENIFQNLYFHVMVNPVPLLIKPVTLLCFPNQSTESHLCKSSLPFPVFLKSRTLNGNSPCLLEWRPPSLSSLTLPIYLFQNSHQWILGPAPCLEKPVLTSCVLLGRPSILI